MKKKTSKKILRWRVTCEVEFKPTDESPQTPEEFRAFWEGSQGFLDNLKLIGACPVEKK